MKTNQEIIIYNECTNGGDRVYTYYSSNIGAMEAYGYSAYLVAKMIESVLCIWDNQLNLPCSIMRNDQMQTLKQMGEEDPQVLSSESVVLILKAADAFDKDGYDQWIQVLKARKGVVARPLPMSEMVNNTKSLKGSHETNYLIVGFIVLFLLVLVFFALVFNV